MKKTEREFLKELEKKAQEQRTLVESEILPEWASGLGVWLAVHPWRVIVPVSFFLILIMKALMKEGFSDFVLAFFGGGN